MKYLQQALTALSVIALVFFGCKKEYSYESPTGGAGVYQWAFTESTNSFKGPMDSAQLDTTGSVHILNMTGHTSDKKDIITLSIASDSVKVGVYQTPRCTFDYLHSGIDLYHSDINATGQFTLTITAMDSISITGTFSGTALDTTKKSKTITAGTFKVKYKSSGSTVTPPPVCRISTILFNDSTSKVNYYAIKSGYTSINAVNSIILYDSIISPPQVDNSYAVSYPTAKVYLDAGGKQYFTLDASGRAVSFTGYDDPMHDTTPPIIATYSYDGSGHLTKRLEALQSAPTVPVLEMDYTYSGNELTQTVLKYGGVQVTTVKYEYDAGKTVKGFLDLHPYSPEIFFFQSAVNTGITCDQALVKATETVYNASQQVVGTYTSILQNYVIDANNYVQSFLVSGDDFTAPTLNSNIGLFSSTYYKLSYHCH